MRPDDWQGRLHAVIESARTQTFQWGEHDCVLFAAECAQAVTGEDYPSLVRTQFNWSTARSASELIASGNGLDQLVTTMLGTEPVVWGWCGAGDIVLALNFERELLTVHDGYQLVAVGETGLVFLPLTAALKGWRL